MEVLTSTMDSPGGVLGRSSNREQVSHDRALEIGGMKVLDHKEMPLVSTTTGTGVVTQYLVGGLHW